MTGSLLPAANLFGAGGEGLVFFPEYLVPGIVRLADFLRTMWI